MISKNAAMSDFNLKRYQITIYLITFDNNSTSKNTLNFLVKFQINSKMFNLCFYDRIVHFAQSNK